jgi:hypothetical protein
MDAFEIRKLFASDRVLVALEQLRLADEELVKRIEMQMKLIELLGLLLLGIYSAVFISKEYAVLLIVPLAAGLVTVWWTDRQRLIILLRHFIVDTIEKKMLVRVLDAGDRMIAEGWQSVLVNNYYRETRTHR